jgi:manganese efflux pump family protein
VGIIELILIAVGLSMDAFAVSICKGLKMKQMTNRQAAVIALFFGGFQGLMPFIGWLLGKSFEQYITKTDHWVAFVLLNLIGIKMLVDAWKGRNSCEVDFEEEVTEGHLKEGQLNIKELFVLAIATSIDALAVGITFALLPNTNILISVCTIGVITFIFSFIGVKLGKRFGCAFKSKAEFAGGMILCIIGIKILVEHLGLLNWL